MTQAKQIGELFGLTRAAVCAWARRGVALDYLLARGVWRGTG
jgi:hypothetical protein